MAAPGVNINIGNGNLGALAPLADGTSAIVLTGVAVGGQFALGDVIGPFESLADAEAVGIDKAYDTTNSTNAWLNIKEFYAGDGTGAGGAGNGTKLYAQVLADTVTLTQRADKANDYARKLVEAAGDAKLMGITRNVPGGFTPSYTDQLEADLLSAYAKAQAMADEQQTKHRPLRVMLECRAWQGTVSTTKDLRATDGPNANRVMTVNLSTLAMKTAVAKSASVGFALGIAAGKAVNRNMGRVKDGAISTVGLFTTNDVSVDALTDANIDSLHDKGFVFARTYITKLGYYINDDNMSCPITDDYANLNRGRVIDKADRIAYGVYVDELKDDVQLNEQGQLDAAVIKSFQGIIETEIVKQMVSDGRQEISSVSAYADPNQNILSTSKVAVELNIIPNGNVKEIVVDLAFDNPQAS